LGWLLSVLRHPITTADRKSAYAHDVSIQQTEFHQPSSPIQGNLFTGSAPHPV
jgi:hypothetical protein